MTLQEFRLTSRCRNVTRAVTSCNTSICSSNRDINPWHQLPPAVVWNSLKSNLFPRNSCVSEAVSGEWALRLHVCFEITLQSELPWRQGWPWGAVGAGDGGSPRYIPDYSLTPSPLLHPVSATSDSVDASSGTNVWGNTKLRPARGNGYGGVWWQNVCSWRGVSFYITLTSVRRLIISLEPVSCVCTWGWVTSTAETGWTDRRVRRRKEDGQKETKATESEKWNPAVLDASFQTSGEGRGSLGGNVIQTTVLIVIRT